MLRKALESKQNLGKALKPFSGLFVGILGTMILFKDLILARKYNVLWASDFDPGLMYWIVEWGYHIFFEEFNSTNFWNANSFYPNSNTLAYSDGVRSGQKIVITTYQINCQLLQPFMRATSGAHNNLSRSLHACFLQKLVNPGGYLQPIIFS